MKKLLIVLAVFMLLTACGDKHKEETPAQNNISNNNSEATLYIGTEGNFKEYTVEIDSLSPENLLKAMSELTDWNLDLAADITTGKGGMSVCLSNNSALFMGPPDPQKDEFHMFDTETLCHTILDSIKKTLQENFVYEGGDPDSIDIYFYMEGEKPLTLENLGMIWSLEEPYSWEAGK
ncbi:MAG: hypothetical protein ACI32B_04190 [Erysipelotrichaceae bacterium]